MAGDFFREAEEQGWKDGAGSLMARPTPSSSANATGLPSPSWSSPRNGCNVKVFTEGLDWSDAPKAGTAAAPAAAAPTDAAGIEAEVQKKPQEALE